MIGQVKTINGVKTVVPLSNEVATDSVALGNMETVTSNAVAQALDNKHFKLITGTFTINSGYININPQMEDANYSAFVQRTYIGSGNLNLLFTVQQYQANVLYIYVRDGNNNVPTDGTQVGLNILIMY